MSTAAAAPPPQKPIEVRSVWSSNLESEFALISHVIDQFPFAAMDTEFPGVVFRSNSGKAPENPSSLYTSLKTNVDALNLIQIGLTLSNSSGNLPDLGTNKRYIWEFNFQEFDVNTDLYNVEAIELLKKQGINFGKNRELGIESGKFAELMITSGLVLAPVTWVTFHCAYDFGYLIKTLTGQRLPETLGEFLTLVRVYFGDNVFDLKYIMKFCEGLYGGLDKVATTMGVERAVGKSHQAGSDSLLTWHTFERIRTVYFGEGGLENFAGVLFGLEVN